MIQWNCRMRRWWHQNHVYLVVTEQLEVVFCGLGSADIQIEKAFKIRSWNRQKTDVFK